ncbi:bifunctional riboflavin kinase/FAD synthetase [Zavarzinia sp. CC-PAN008]|uniref:bifunctional riboflavin kinase/FAD synthetase n=1 Tax=Zavarzinia sp. CC-PAN008 TaxID=3243332 RepID=UPI003F744543
MLIVEGDTAPSPAAQGAVLALGNFDGVHRGHQVVLGEARRIAGEMDVPFGVLTFEPHPRRYFRPDDPPFRITPPASKARALAGLGCDVLAIQAFDQRLAGMLAQDFVIELLVERLRAVHVVIGFDFCFGKGRSGNATLLAQMAEMEGFGLTVVEAVREGGQLFSSTAVRSHLAEGRPREAAKLLGRAFEIESTVLKGDQRGRTIGFPTANLNLGDYVVPRLGVYSVRAQTADGTWHDGVANLGRRPTFDKQDVNLEVHLFDFAGDLYGQVLRVAVMDFVRPEQKFSGLDALKAQIAADAATARAQLMAG